MDSDFRSVGTSVSTGSSGYTQCIPMVFDFRFIWGPFLFCFRQNTLRFFTSFSSGASDVTVLNCFVPHHRWGLAVMLTTVRLLPFRTLNPHLRHLTLLSCYTFCARFPTLLCFLFAVFAVHRDRPCPRIPSGSFPGTWCLVRFWLGSCLSCRTYSCPVTVMGTIESLPSSCSVALLQPQKV